MPFFSRNFLFSLNFHSINNYFCLVNSSSNSLKSFFFLLFKFTFGSTNMRSALPCNPFGMFVYIRLNRSVSRHRSCVIVVLMLHQQPIWDLLLSPSPQRCSIPLTLFCLHCSISEIIVLFLFSQVNSQSLVLSHCINSQ